MSKVTVVKDCAREVRQLLGKPAEEADAALRGASSSILAPDAW